MAFENRPMPSHCLEAGERYLRLIYLVFMRCCFLTLCYAEAPPPLRASVLQAVYADALQRQLICDATEPPRLCATELTPHAICLCLRAAFQHTYIYSDAF